MARKKFHVLTQHLQEVMEESLPKMVDARVKELTKTQVPIFVAQGLIMERQQSQADVVDSSVRTTCQVIFCMFIQLKLAHEHQYQLYLTMKDNPQLQHDDLLIWLALKIKFEGLQASNTSCTPSSIRLRYQDDPYNHVHPEGENSAKRQTTFEHRTYVFGESSSGQDNESEPGPSMSGNQEQLDDFDFWTDSYVTDDDELPTEKVSQEIVEEMSQTVDEAKLPKVILSLPFLQNPTPVVQSCQRDPKAHALSLINQDLLYLKKGNSRLKKIMLSLHKFPAVIFPNDEIEERTSRWVDKCVKKFNPYARYSVEHWKNPHAKIFYIKRQKESGKPKE
ncbi:hypothetical protein Tco_1104106 [Tanacetum coccineum]